MQNDTCKTTKMSRNQINQDHLEKEDQQRSENDALDMMNSINEHQKISEDDDIDSEDF